MECAERFSTDNVPPGQRLAAWKAATSDRLVELDFRILNRDEFTGSILHRDLTMLSLTKVLAAAHHAKRITRSRRRMARASEDFFLICLQLEGGCRLYQDGREAILNPGEFVLSDTTRPYELVMDEDYELITLRVPRRTLMSRVKDCHTLTASTIPVTCGPARMFLQMVRSVADDAGSWYPGVVLDVADSLLGALTGGLRALRDTDLRPSSSDKQVAGIKAYVLAHLGDPELKVSTIARALGLSRSYLHRVFQNEAITLDRWIWARRLDACERALADPSSVDQSITEIAFTWGFSDVAHFSRSFRRRFGISPRERQNALRSWDSKEQSKSESDEGSARA